MNETATQPFSHWINTAESWKTQALVAFDSHEGGYAFALICAFVLPLVRRILRKVVYEPYGKKVITERLKKSDEKASIEDLLYKWNESCWKASFYIAVVAVGITAVWKEKFITDTRYFWIGCNQFPPCNYEVPLLIRTMYSLELGFYVQAVPYLILWEVRRKDFWENFAHHLATIGLIVYSYQVNFMKIGCMVFLCHDINDVFLETAKLAKYAQREGAASMLFAFFVVSWFSSRMTYFPLWIIRSAWSEPLTIIANVYNISPHPHHEIFLSLLCFLFLLHCYWSYLILRVAFKQVSGHKVNDIREEEDD